MKPICICGKGKSEAIIKKDFFVVTSEGVTLPAIEEEMILNKCLNCGLIRQEKFPESYEKFYENYEPVNKEYFGKSYEHDRTLAEKRAKEYSKVNCLKENLLDVGSGSGAFVDECRDRGIEAFGCEIANYSYEKTDKYIYKNKLEKIYFPTDKFEVVTCHDVLEHVENPLEFAKELFRITNQNGTCIIDFPAFFREAGKHHWKKEHLWFFNGKQLEAMLKDVGFEIFAIKNPIESKIVFYCKKPEQQRPSILYPPGIGDSFWSIIKTEAFLKKEKLNIPNIHVVSNEDAFNGHKRAFPFIEMFPFLKSTGISFSNKSGAKERAIWKEAYAQTGRTIFNNVINCDYFIAYNGHLRVGEQMEDIDPDLRTNWFPNMFVSLEQLNFQKECREKYGKYILFYFIFQGTYAHWTKEFPISSIVEYIKVVTKMTGCTPILVGSVFDKTEPNHRKLVNELPSNVIDLCGETTVQQLFGLIKGSELVVGYPSGLTIMSGSLRKKTLTIWNHYYNKRFSWYCCPPEVKNKTYFIENTKGLSPEILLKKSIQIIENEIPEERKVFLEEISLSERHVVPPRRVKERKRNLNQKKIKTRGLDLSFDSGNFTIACVLKTGGVFGKKYALKLKEMISRNVFIKHKFVILTDLEEDFSQDIKPLENDLPGWWSKLELFRIKGPVLYIDLDTIILEDIDFLCKSVAKMPKNSFRMLVPFNPARKATGQWASGIMAWHGDFSYLLDDFELKGNERAWDQVYIFKKLRENKVEIKAINDFSRIYSYKRHCSNGVPEGAEIICFHGTAKPHVLKNTEIVRNHWK